MDSQPGHLLLGRRATLLVLCCVVPLVALELFPALHVRLGPVANSQLHTALEAASIVVSIMIFSVSWHSLAWNRDSLTAVACMVFGSVAMADLTHVLLFESTTGFAAGTGLARVFIPFFIGRLLTALVLLVMAMEIRLGDVPVTWRHLMTGVSLLVGLGAAGLGVIADTSQMFFVPGVGLTGLKVTLEWGLIALNVLAAALFLRRHARTGHADSRRLATALLVMALSEFAFTRYAAMSDSYFVYGHVLKVVAYVVLYHTLFVQMLSRPYVELLEARRSLAETSERWHMLFEHSLDAVVLGTPDGGVIAANPAACALFRATERDLVLGGRQMIVVPDDPRLVALLQQRQQTGHARGQVRFRRKDGTVFEAEVASAVYHDSLQRPLTSVLIRDVSERRAAEAQILELNDTLERRVRERTRELERANAEVAQFAWGIAHDLRAPLAAIGGFAGVVQKRWATLLPPPGQHYLDRIVNNVVRMEGLIEAILGLYRLSQSQFHERELDLSLMARQVAEDLAFTEPQRQVQVFIEPGLRARGDQALVHALLQNLIGNAWKFTSKTEQARIEVRRHPAGGFQVQDNGTGFEAGKAAQLFTMFRRLHDEQQFTGHGLGLAGARRIVERHGGAISIEGRPGEGATVRFDLGERVAA